MLFSIKRILVCTDLTEKADEVLINAEALRKRTNAELDILHVSDLGLRLEWSADTTKKETFYDAFVEGIANDLKSKLQAQIERTGVKGNPLFAEGHAVDKINDLIVNGDKKYDLLVIGHNSKAGTLHHVLGSVARKIASSAPIPTIIVKRDMEFNTIGAFVDGTRPVDWMVTSSLDFYRSFKFGKIEFVTLWFDLPEPFQEEESASAVASKLDEEIKYFIHGKENFSIRVEPSRELFVAYHLARIADEDKIDLAVMKRNRGKKLNKKLLGSETLRMLELNTPNILILPV